MPERLTNDPVKMGFLLPVKNTNKKISEKDKYLALKVEESNGKNEEWLLFTEKDILSKRSLSICDVTPNWKLGRMYPLSIGEKSYVACKVTFCEGLSSDNRKYSKKEEVVLLLSKSSIESARKRAKSNPEDIPTQSRLSDLFD